MSTNAIALRNQPQSLNRFEQREVIDTIKQTVCKGATDAQLNMFLEVCKATGLDPFLKEIWYVAEKGIIMAARDGYLRVANEHPQFDGIETRVERNDNNIPIKAVCTVWRKDRAHPTICEAYYNEYNKQSPVWKQYPSAMISKVAEVLALKRSFAINGVVSEEEVGNEPIQSQGSREAQTAVRDRKLAEIRQGQSPSAEPHTILDDSGKPVAEAQHEGEAQPSTLDQILATFAQPKNIEPAFQQMRSVIDSIEYESIMRANGLGPGENRTVGKARKAFTALWAAYHRQMQESIATGEGAEVAE
jgi:phage recombination protein Bet